jgi:hypothetical protein
MGPFNRRRLALGALYVYSKIKKKHILWILWILSRFSCVWVCFILYAAYLCLMAQDFMAFYRSRVINRHVCFPNKNKNKIFQFIFELAVDAWGCARRQPICCASTWCWFCWLHRKIRSSKLYLPEHRLKVLSGRVKGEKSAMSAFYPCDPSCNG